MTTLRDVVELRRPVFLASDATTQECAGESTPILRRWQQELFGVQLSAMVLCMPPALAHLLAHGALPRFELSAVRKLGQGVPLANLFAQARQRCLDASDEEEEQEQDPVNANKLVALATTLQGFLEWFVPGVQSQEDCEEATEECNRWSQWLVSCARSLTRKEMLKHRVQKAKSNLFKVGKKGTSDLGGVRYAAPFAVQAMMLSSYLHCADDLDSVISQAVRVAYPTKLAEQLLTLVRDLPLPNAATLSRWRIRLDVSLMLVQRSRHQQLLQNESMFFSRLATHRPSLAVNGL